MLISLASISFRVLADFCHFVCGMKACTHHGVFSRAAAWDRGGGVWLRSWLLLLGEVGRRGCALHFFVWLWSLLAASWAWCATARGFSVVLCARGVSGALPITWVGLGSPETCSASETTLYSKTISRVMPLMRHDRLILSLVTITDT